jgi:hypothetical protein
LLPREFDVINTRQGRRFWRYALVPVVVMSLLLCAAKLATLQRASMIEELTDRIDNGSAVEGALAVRQLARVRNPPMAVLVTAARAAERAIAVEAQRAIDELLSLYQQNIVTGRDINALAEQLETLVTSLAHEQAAFLKSDQAWIGATTKTVLQLANQLPANLIRPLAIQADGMLAAIETDDVAQITAPATHLPAPLDPEIDERAARLRDAVSTERSALDEHHLERDTASRVVLDPEPLERH